MNKDNAFLSVSLRHMCSLEGCSQGPHSLQLWDFGHPTAALGRPPHAPGGTALGSQDRHRGERASNSLGPIDKFLELLGREGTRKVLLSMGEQAVPFRQ